MSAAENKALIRRWIHEFWNAGNATVADELVHPDYTEPQGGRGPEPHKAGLALWKRILPDIHFTLDEVIAEGNTVVVRWTATGTHLGEWPTGIGTVAATGKATTTSGTSTFHLRDGQIVADFNHIDFLSTLRQIGATVILPSADT